MIGRDYNTLYTSLKAMGIQARARVWDLLNFTHIQMGTCIVSALVSEDASRP